MVRAPRAQSKSPLPATRILGPYPDGKRWRVILFSNGKRSAHTAKTRDQALEIIQHLRQRPPDLQAKPLDAALREYDSHLRFSRRLSPSSCDNAQRTLRAFLGDSTDDPIASLTSQNARQLARFEHPQALRIRRRYSLSTRYAVLGHAFRFFDWAKSSRYVERNPFDGVRPVGLVGPGPSPLTLDRARTLATITMHRAADDPGALGALLILVMGLRSGQVLPLRVSDIDLEHKRLLISAPAGTARTVTIPELLLPCLRAVQAGKPSDALLIGPGRTGKARPHNFLWRAVQRLCKQAGVTATCPRSLRKLHIKLTQTATRASERISAHPSTSASNTFTQTRSDASAPAVRVVDLLGLSLSTTSPRLDAVLSILSADQLAQLRQLLDPPLAA